MSIGPPRLSKEDFPSESQWIDRLLRPLNSFMSRASSLLSSALVDGGNVFLVPLTIQTGGAVADSFPLYFDVSGKPRRVVVAKIENKTDGSTFSTAVFPTWEPANKDGKYRVKVRHLTGLSTSTKYEVTFEVRI